MILSEHRTILSKTTGYFFVFFSLGMTLSIVGPSLFGISEIIHRPIVDLGIIFTAREIGGMFTSFLGARLYDRVPGHYLLAGGTIIGAALFSLIPLAPSLLVLCIIFIFLGVSLGLLDIGCNALLIWVHRDKVAPYMNSLHFFFGIGAFISPLIVAESMRLTGTVKLAYWIMAAIMLPPAINILRLPSPARPPKTDEKGQTVKPNYLMMLMIAFFLAMYVGAEIAYGGWISGFVLVQKLASETSAAYLASVFWGAFTFGRLAGISVARRLSPDRLLFLCLGGGLCCVLLLFLGPASISLIFVATFGFGFFIGPIFATMMAMMGRVVHVTGKTTGLIFVGAGLGAMTIPWGVGRLIAFFGPQAFAYCVAIPLLADILILSSILALQKKQQTAVKASQTQPYPG